MVLLLDIVAEYYSCVLAPIDALLRAPSSGMHLHFLAIAIPDIAP